MELWYVGFLDYSEYFVYADCEDDAVAAPRQEKGDPKALVNEAFPERQGIWNA